MAPPADSPVARHKTLLRGVSSSLTLAALFAALLAPTVAQAACYLLFALLAATGFLAGESGRTRTGSLLTSSAPLVVPWAGFVHLFEGQGAVEATWLALATTLGVLLLPLRPALLWGIAIPASSAVLMWLAGIPTTVVIPVASACLVVGISTGAVGYSLALLDRSVSNNRKLAEQYRRSVEHALQEATLAKQAQDHFVAMLTHDLRTPLMGVLGGARLLVDARLAPEQRHTAEIIEESGKALLTIIDDLLDVSRIEQGEAVVRCEAVEPLELTIEQVRSVTVSGRSVVPLIYTGPARLPTVHADRHRLGQVLAHLLSAAAQSARSGHIAVDGVVRGRLLGLVVRDRAPLAHGSEGAGWSTPPGGVRQPGADTAVGLAIARKLMEAMGGKLEVPGDRAGEFIAWVPIHGQADHETQSGDGLSALVYHPLLAQRTALVRWLEGWGYGVVAAGDDEAALQSLRARRFDIVLVSDHAGSNLRGALPAHRIWLGREGVPPGESALDTPLHPLEVRGALLEDLFVADEADELSDTGVVAAFQARILLAEDNPTNRTVLRAMLGTLGCRVQVVDNGAQALHAVAGQHFDLVLMDCQMPGMDGFEATRAILESGADVPVVALTASASLDVQKRCVDAGMATYLTKPVSLDRLKMEIRRHCVI